MPGPEDTITPEKRSGAAGFTASSRRIPDRRLGQAPGSGSRGKDPIPASAGMTGGTSGTTASRIAEPILRRPPKLADSDFQQHVLFVRSCETPIISLYCHARRRVRATTPFDTIAVLVVRRGPFLHNGVFPTFRLPAREPNSRHGTTVITSWPYTPIWTHVFRDGQRSTSGSRRSEKSGGKTGQR